MPYFVRFSEQLRLATAEEKQWWQELIDTAKQDLGFGCKLRQDERGDYVWIYSPKYADISKTCRTVQDFLKKFVPDGAWAISWANGHRGDKPGFRAFGGGVAVVTPYAIQCRTTDSWLVSAFTGFSGVCVNTTRKEA